MYFVGIIFLYFDWVKKICLHFSSPFNFAHCSKKNRSSSGQYWTNCLARSLDSGTSVMVMRWRFEGAANDTLHMRVSSAL